MWRRRLQSFEGHSGLGRFFDVFFFCGHVLFGLVLDVVRMNGLDRDCDLVSRCVSLAPARLWWQYSDCIITRWIYRVALMNLRWVYSIVHIMQSSIVYCLTLIVSVYGYHVIARDAGASMISKHKDRTTTTPLRPDTAVGDDKMRM